MIERRGRLRRRRDPHHRHDRDRKQRAASRAPPDPVDRIAGPDPREQDHRRNRQDDEAIFLVPDR